MTRKLQPLEIPLGDELKQAVYGITTVDGGGSSVSVGELIKRAKAAQALVDRAVEENPLVKIAAQEEMRRLGKRGAASIRVTPDGAVVLHVSYGAETGPPRSSLPPISELRERAKELKVDISDLGRKKRAILERIREAEVRQGRASLYALGGGRRG